MADLGFLGGPGGCFDANKVEPVSFEVLPPGPYDVIIVASERKPTADGNGQYLELQLQVISGPFQNRKLYDRLNLVNQNQTAVQIAYGTLSSICRAVGVMTPQQSEELHNRPLVAVVKQRKRADNGETTNEVAGYKPRQSQPPSAPVQAPVAPQPSLPPGYVQPQVPAPQPGQSVPPNGRPW